MTGNPSIEITQWDLNFRVADDSPSDRQILDFQRHEDVAPTRVHILDTKAIRCGLFRVSLSRLQHSQSVLVRPSSTNGSQILLQSDERPSFISSDLILNQSLFHARASARDHTRALL